MPFYYGNVWYQNGPLSLTGRVIVEATDRDNAWVVLREQMPPSPQVAWEVFGFPSERPIDLPHKDPTLIELDAH